jgi:hypothetical protein
MQKWVLASYYTVGTVYEKVFADHLGKSLEKFPLIKKEIYTPQPRGSWNKNLVIKPEIILRTLQLLPPDKLGVLYTDADSELWEYPELIDRIQQIDNPPVDIAFHVLDHDSWYGKTNHQKEEFCGTMYIRNSPQMQAFVKRWYELCAADTRVWEPFWFKKTLEEFRPTLSITELPLEYAYITSLPDGRKPLVDVKKPVICHFQASRTCKQKVQA